jgi:hypothetical protein
MLCSICIACNAKAFWVYIMFTFSVLSSKTNRIENSTWLNFLGHFVLGTENIFRFRISKN